MSRMPAQVIGAFAFLSCFVGTFLPWAKAGDLYSESGMDGPGIVALLFAAAGAFTIYTASNARSAMLAAACAIALIAVGVLGVISVRNGIEEELGDFNDLLGLIDQQAKVGVGLYLIIGGAVVALLASLAHSVSIPSQNKVSS